AATAWLMWHFRPFQLAAPQRNAGTIATRFGAVLQAPWSRVVLLCVFVEGFLLVGALAFVPTHLHRTYGIPLTLAGFVVMLFGAGGLVYAALSAALVRRLGEPGLAFGGGILLFMCFTGIAARSTLLIAAAACLIAGLGFYMLHNTLQ